MKVRDYQKIQENKKEIKMDNLFLILIKLFKIVFDIKFKTLTKSYSKKNKFKQKFRNLKMINMNQT